jgi:hypothetical protein
VKKVYIAGPYGRRSKASIDQITLNLNRAINMARLLIGRGYAPLVPHLYHFIHIGWSSTPDEDAWWEVCAAWIGSCDALLRLKGESVGADREVQKAIVMGVPVFYSVEGLLKWLEAS